MKTETLFISMYFLVIAIIILTEIIIQKKIMRTKSQKPDAGLALIINPFYLVLFLAPVEFRLLNRMILEFTAIPGYILLVSGFILRINGLLALRQNFSVAIECKDKNHLVTTGIYAYVRHPLYLSVILIAGSACIIFTNIYCWFIFALMFYGISLRIDKEEKFLINEFSEYSGYMKNTKKIIPFIY